MRTRLIIIRHGETDWNAQKRYMGSTDIELNDTGRAQAEDLKLKIAPHMVDKVYSSNAKRAARFAERVFGGMPIEAVAELREMGFGIFEGNRYEELMEKYPDLYRSWVENPFGIEIPGGEAPGRFRDRVISAFDRIASAGSGKTSAVVTHGGPIGVFVSAALGSDDVWSAMPATGEMVVLEPQKGGRWVRSHL